MIWYTEYMTETYTDDKPKSKKKFTKLQKHLIIFAFGILVAFIAITAVRFALAKDPSVHYHANFALHINGQRDEFKSFAYYEEVAACDTHESDNPKVRTHMHDNKNHLVHVHDSGVTWAAFLANLGYTLGDNLIQTDDGVYITGDDGNKLSFTLNGQSENLIANKVIQNEDVLLINYGKDNQQTLGQRYDAIPKDAHQANVTKDPAACSGGHEFTFWARLKQALGVPAESH
jgi:hypothetical protein